MAQDPADIWAMSDLATPFAVRTVATLRVADVVKDGPVGVAELAQQCDAQADPLGRILRFLVQRGLFSEPETDVFGPNAASRVLEDDDPRGVRAWLDLDGAIGRADLALVELIEQVRGHHSAYSTAFGRSFWEDLAQNAELSESFDNLMESKTYGLGPSVAAAYDWSRFDRVVDVGGGKGALIAEILHAHPTVRGVVVDLPGPAGHAEEYLAERGVQDRAEIVPGDFFRELPPGADAYVLCDVLGDWDDADATRILSRCAEAGAAEASTLIVEMMPEDDDMETFTEMDLRMMVYVGGRMRDLERTRSVAAAAGLFIADVTELEDGYRIIECLPDR